MEFVKQFHERDADLAQRIVDSLESVWPEAEALEKRLVGATPPKIKAKPFTLWFNADGSSAEPNAPGAHAKEYAGGYYPIVFDKRFSSAGSRQEEKAMAGGDFQLFQPGVERAITPHGYLNKRIEDFARPVELSLTGLFRHLPAASKDIGMREALIDAHDMVSDSRFRAEDPEDARRAGPRLPRQVGPGRGERPGREGRRRRLLPGDGEPDPARRHRRGLRTQRGASPSKTSPAS